MVDSASDSGPSGSSPSWLLGALPGPLSFGGRAPNAHAVDGPRLEAGEEVAGFRLVRRIGRGGMGEVWEALQLSLGARQVALKFVREGGVTPRQLEYFAREARAGGRLAHPGLVSVYASGEAQGLAWIAMELVEGGRTLRGFLDEAVRAEELPADHDRRVATSVAVIADAMQAAHDARVIHRDLKPQNILVTPAGHPKVTDFGVARLSDESGFTQTGELAGTYAYMSPEQVTAKHGSIDHRSDVFSLGVILYELLTLRRPFHGDTSHEIAAQILLADPPDPRSIRSRVPRDLVVIVGKALEKDRERRYRSMAELADDLRRFLADEPILARPLSRGESVLKWVRRNPTRALLIATATTAFCLVSALLIVYVRANAEKALRTREAQASARRAEHVTELVQEALISADPSQGGDGGMLVIDAMERVVRYLDEGYLADDPETEAALQVTVARILDGNARSAEALVLAERALATRRRLIEGDHEDIALALDRVASSLDSLGRSREALPLYQEALEMLRRLHAGDAEEVATALNNLAYIQNQLGHGEEALALHEESLSMRRRVFDGPHADVANSLGNLSSCLWSLKRFDESLVRAEEAFAMAAELFDPDELEFDRYAMNLALSLGAAGREDEALPVLQRALERSRQAYGGEHPVVADCLANVAYHVNSTSGPEAALELYQEALDMRRRLFPGAHPDVANSLNNVASCLEELERRVEAVARFEEALAMFRLLHVEDHRDVVLTAG